MKKVRHVLGISGGKDSAALAIYMKDKYPNLDIEYYTCDTGKELEETYQLITNLEIYLGKKINLLQTDETDGNPFDYFLKKYKGYLPSSNARWCTKNLKLEPFEAFVGDDNVISYVGIRGDEDREGYISRKPNIQSIFPFRKNIWSEDVIAKVLSESNSKHLLTLNHSVTSIRNSVRFEEIFKQPLTEGFTQSQKLNYLLDISTKEFNLLVYNFLKSTNYPLAFESNFELVDNEEVLVRDDIFKILKDSGVGVPEYYNKVDFEINGQIGQYSRSRSGCYFCFFQQKIEWIWLYEQHPERFAKAQEYEKEGYSWCQGETLEDIIKPERMHRIKEDHLKKVEKNSRPESPYLINILGEEEGEGCAACFI